jgi:ribosomal protein S10
VSRPAHRVAGTARISRQRREQDVTLLELLDRLLQGGIVIQGDITLAAADIDLVDVSLRLIVGAVDRVGRDLRGPIRDAIETR